jgi:hypothetical protein
MKTKIVVALTIIFLIAGASTLALAVTYTLQESNHITVTVTSGSVNVPVVLSVNSTSITDLDHLQITAITNSQGNGLTAKFYDGTILLGSQVINNGQAQITVQLATGSHDIASKP